MLDRTKTGSGYLPQLMGVSREGGGGLRPFERKRERRGGRGYKFPRYKDGMIG